MNAAETLRAAVARLAAEGVPDAARDARLLIAEAMGIGVDRLTLHLSDPLEDEAAARLERMIERRAAREPVSHILERRMFWGRDFRVTRDVLDPRPETETLVAEALAAPFSRVLDLGTGSGAILLSLLADRAGATGLGADLSPAALAVASGNAQALGLQSRADFVLSDWFSGIAGTFDLIASNPPYIAEAEMEGLSPEVRDHEPHMALTRGGDGLGAYRAIAAGVVKHLVPGGRVLVEIGPTQGAAVCALFGAAGLQDLRILVDLDGRDRVVAAKRR